MTLPPLPVPRIGRMGYNPANFAYRIGTGPWVPGYAVSYAISFYDATTERESRRSRWWGPDRSSFMGALASYASPWIRPDK